MLKTVTLHVRVFDPDGDLVPGVVVQARLATIGISQPAAGFVDRTLEEGITDVNGETALELWPNYEGTTGAEYRITCRAADGLKLLDEMVSIPNVDSDIPVWLHDILLLPPPSPKPYDEAAIELITETKVIVIDARDRAEAAAKSASDSAAAAKASEIAAADSAAAAKESELSAKESADRVEEIRSDVEQVKGDVAILTGEVAALTGEVATISSDVDALKIASAEHGQDIAEIKSELDGLGTAATHDVQTSVVDAGAGKVLLPGAFGLGGTLADLIATSKTGFFFVSSATEGPLADNVTVRRYSVINLLDTDTPAQLWLTGEPLKAFGRSGQVSGGVTTWGGFSSLAGGDTEDLQNQINNINNSITNINEILVEAGVDDLGTAAKENIQSTAYAADGNVMRVGGFGWGGSADLLIPSFNAPNTATGAYKVNPGSLTSGPFAEMTISSAEVLHIRVTSTLAYQLLFVRQSDGSTSSFVRSYGGSTWSPWSAMSGGSSGGGGEGGTDPGDWDGSDLGYFTPDTPYVLNEGSFDYIVDNAIYDGKSITRPLIEQMFADKYTSGNVEALAAGKYLYKVAAVHRTAAEQGALVAGDVFDKTRPLTIYIPTAGGDMQSGGIVVGASGLPDGSNDSTIRNGCPGIKVNGSAVTIVNKGVLAGGGGAGSTFKFTTSSAAPTVTGFVYGSAGAGGFAPYTDPVVAGIRRLPFDINDENIRPMGGNWGYAGNLNGGTNTQNLYPLKSTASDILKHGSTFQINQYFMKSNGTIENGANWLSPADGMDYCGGDGGIAGQDGSLPIKWGNPGSAVEKSSLGTAFNIPIYGGTGGGGEYNGSGFAPLHEFGPDFGFDTSKKVPTSVSGSAFEPGIAGPAIISDVSYILINEGSLMGDLSGGSPRNVANGFKPGSTSERLNQLEGGVSDLRTGKRGTVGSYLTATRVSETGGVMVDGFYDSIPGSSLKEVALDGVTAPSPSTTLSGKYRQMSYADFSSSTPSATVAMFKKIS